MNRCPSKTELHQLLKGELPSGDMPVIKQHAEQCPECCKALEQLCDVDETDNWRTWWQEENSALSGTELLDGLTRYRRKEVLGSGSFGTVYRCYDTVLEEDVAIKVPHRSRISSPRDVDAYLDEARKWARLGHAGIARFLHADRAGGSCFVVSKFIDGMNLKDRIRDSKFLPSEAVAIVTQVAEALHHVHIQRIYHRDIKPSNILLDRQSDRPYITDFGLAIREEEVGSGPRTAGSLAYMSPEQARGEGHFVDGRTDIYSLGVVLYEMLTGQRPFRSEDPAQLMQQIVSRPVPPLRALRADIPRELERICLKALSKRISDRYLTAQDMAEDLEHWTKDQETKVSRRAKIVPKGLSSFDANDAYFFLDLLPGPRDRDGLPESIRTWKTRIEQKDPDETFRVGLISGPSGCGKSSLVKAGLLPRLRRNIVPIYVAADTEKTEERLLSRLRRGCPDLSPEAGIVESVAAIRTGQAAEDDVRVLLVIDQFEQWLHATSKKNDSDLLKALRQCDGHRVQCILIVRDDFYTAVGQFMDELEVRLIQGETFDRVDLFDLQHAREVLAEFGRAYGRLPENLGEMSNEHEEFLDNVVAECAVEESVIPLRLALFAHMLRNKNWDSRTLAALGGIEGIGTTFLEEEFGHKNPYQGRFQDAAQAILKSLLPEHGTELSTQIRSRDQLLASSGLSNERGEFQGLLNRMEFELKLISPADAEALTCDDEPGLTRASTSQHYQLTHDFLVPSLREWLHRRQRETRRGRTELMMAERSVLWNSRRERKQLPTELEWVNILLLIRRNQWTKPQRKMMAAAGRLYLSRMMCTILAFFAIGIGIWFGSYRSGQLTMACVSRATQAWQDGRVTEALDQLVQARGIRRDHPAIQQLITQMSLEGGVAFQAEPADCTFEISPDPKTDEDLSNGCLPAVISKLTSRIRVGQHVRLAPGHYRVSIYLPTGRLVASVPWFIDRVGVDMLSRTAGESASFPVSHELQDLHFAQQLNIPLGEIPSDSPNGYAYINPGPMWRSPDPRSRSADEVASLYRSPTSGEPNDDLRIHDVSKRETIVRDYLDHGLLMAKAETTWGEFRKWWGDGKSGLGPQYCEWQMEGVARLVEAVAETDDVPRSIKMDCWREKLAKQGIDVNDLADGEIIETVFHQVRSLHKARWNEFEQLTTQKVLESDQQQDQLPVPVGQTTAIAYARTHAPIDPRQFKLWLAGRIREVDYYVDALEELKSELSGRLDSFIGPDELPPTPLVRNHLSRIEAFEHARPLLPAYEEWLRVRTYYGYQVPIERILKTSATADSGQTIDLQPSTWLWGEPETGIRNPLWGPRILVDSYAKEIADGEEKPLREHFVNWLGWMILLEKAEKRRNSELLACLEEQGTLDPVPFSLRYRFGRHLGWDIPTSLEWERAFRGADDRLYTWGAHEGGYAQVNDEKGPLPAVMAESTVKDTSPYDILHMAGNLSEWVRLTENALEPVVLNGNTLVVPNDMAWKASFPERFFLMGGNFLMDDRLTQAGFYLSLPRIGPVQRNLEEPGGPAAPWTGFRVVKRITGGTFESESEIK